MWLKQAIILGHGCTRQGKSAKERIVNQVAGKVRSRCLARIHINQSGFSTLKASASLQFIAGLQPRRPCSYVKGLAFLRCVDFEIALLGWDLKIPGSCRR